jgi:3-oxoacyl-[acyl-carrier protein] reductase
MFQGVALITGGSSGIGKALAERLLSVGANVALCGRDSARLEQTIAELEPQESRFLAVCADVTQPQQMEEFVTLARNKFGRIDALINSAGVGYLGSLTDTPEQEIARLLDTNVKGALFACQAVWPQMMEQKSGHIINLCGILGVKAIANAALYCASKHAVVGMGSALALEGRRHGIRVTSLCCSGVDTPFWDSVPGKPRAEVLLSPQEVAQAMADLLACPSHVIPNQLLLQHVAHQL